MNNNTTKVTVKMVPRSNDDNSNLRARAEVQAEINSYKVSIDRTVFTKTKAEKEELKRLKSQWKLSLKKVA